MDAQQKTAIIMAAIQATPKTSEHYAEDVMDTVRDIFVMADPDNSPAGKLLDKLEGRPGKKDRVVGHVLGVTLEETSTRGIIHLFTGITDDRPDGIETFRTDRTDTEAGLRMANFAGSLTGHRVLLFKYMEPIGNGREVRMCIHLVDMGLSDLPQAQQAKASRDAAIASRAQQGAAA